MSLLASIPFININRLIPRQLISPNWRDREEVLADDVNLFCWKRERPDNMISYLDRLIQGDLIPMSLTFTDVNLADKLSKTRVLWDPDHEPLADLFWIDVHQIAQDFLQLTAHKQATLHLRVVADNACAKFHTDGYDLRLFTTYYGLGTEWLPEKAVNRAALGSSNKKIVKNKDQTQQVATGHVAILKGELPNKREAVRGIVHRSPEIQQKGEKRIILRIDI